jgi:hypothetical protein
MAASHHRPLGPGKLECTALPRALARLQTTKRCCSRHDVLSCPMAPTRTRARRLFICGMSAYQLSRRRVLIYLDYVVPLLVACTDVQSQSTADPPKRKKKSKGLKGSPTTASARNDSDASDGEEGKGESEAASPRASGQRRPSKKLLEGVGGLVMDESRWRKKQGISDTTKVFGLAWPGLAWPGLAWPGVLSCAVLCCTVLCCIIL